MMMQVTVVINVSGGDTRGVVIFPERPWENIMWHGYPGQWAAEGIFSTVSRLLRGMMPLGLTITDARVPMVGGA